MGARSQRLTQTASADLVHQLAALEPQSWTTLNCSWGEVWHMPTSGKVRFKAEGKRKPAHITASPEVIAWISERLADKVAGDVAKTVTLYIEQLRRAA